LKFSLLVGTCIESINLIYSEERTETDLKCSLTLPYAFGVAFSSTETLLPYDESEYLELFYIFL